MKVIACLLVVLGLCCAAAGLNGFEVPWILPLSSVFMAGILLTSGRVPRFIATFIGTLAVAHIFLVLPLLAKAFGKMPFGWEEFVPPPTMAVAASVSAALIYASSFIPVIRIIMAVGDRFFRAEEPGTFTLGPLGIIRAREGSIAVALLAIIILINLLQVAINVRLSFFSRDMFNSLQNKDSATFWYQILVVFLSFAMIFIISAVAEQLVRYFLQIRWRTYLNNHYVENWLGGGLHYEMQLTGDGTDNPDQRIAADLKDYVEYTFELSIQLLNQSATLVSFVLILWTLSSGIPIPGTDIQMPGVLVWVAIIYAVLGTWLIHMLGRPLIGLNFMKEKVEADYRFSLARVREYSEQIALLKGQPAEAEGLNRRFEGIARNYIDIAWRTTKVLAFRAGFLQVNSVFPYILVAPYFFLDKITLGQMQQTASVFGSFQDATSFFILAYVTLAAYKAVIDRLNTFEHAMKRTGREHAAHPPAEISASKEESIVLDRVTARLPDGKALMTNIGLHFRPGEATLLTGPSGSGKSTLFRTIAGIWPFSSGHIYIPAGNVVMGLPQRPYIPQGTLRDAVIYPATAGTYTDDEVIAALEAARLGQFVGQLGKEGLWGHTLSIGEQQRLSVARALLAKPDWLLLDEATAALDEKTEMRIYDVLKRNLPNTTLISIGHRSSLLAFHQRRINARKDDDGNLVWEDATVTAPQETSGFTASG